MDRAQACLPADVMKVDHTFDVNLSFCFQIVAQS